MRCTTDDVYHIRYLNPVMFGFQGQQSAIHNTSTSDLAKTHCSRLRNCRSIHRDPELLLDAYLPRNLLTCGLWTTLTTRSHEESSLRPFFDDNVEVNILLGRFDSLSPDATSMTEAYAARYAVGAVMVALETSMVAPKSAHLRAIGPCKRL